MNSIYQNIKTFYELCAIGCEFIKGNVIHHPFLPTNNSRDNLYELVGEYGWIREYLYEFNQLGFYTIMSQPGNSKSIDIYSNYYEYKKYSISDNIKTKINLTKVDRNFGTTQRAEVEGFMKYDKAIQIYSMLKNDPNIIILISTNKEKENENEISNSLDKYTTLSYETIDTNIRFMEIEDEYNEIIRLKYKNYKRDERLKLMNHVIRRYFEINKFEIKKHIPNILDTDIVGISIMDRVWNRNDYLWDKILICLKKISI